MQPKNWRALFLEQHGLPDTYLTEARRWFDPLAKELAVRRKAVSGPLKIAISGCQGSGKTTLCDYLATFLRCELGLKTISLSLDDFYLTREERVKLSHSVHPLFVTRGVPGTHDISLLLRTLDDLSRPESLSVDIPRFNKAADDRLPEVDWDSIATPVDVIFLEGWCLGAQPQTDEQLVAPVNSLEELDDPDGTWRKYVNRKLSSDFPALHRKMDLWIMLRAPSFQAVYQWRLEQERKLAQRFAGEPSSVMDEPQVSRFIQHFQRLTENILEHLPEQVDYLFLLDRGRMITQCKQPSPRKNKC